MLITNCQLSSQQLGDLEQLRQRCKKIDGNDIPIYPNLLTQQRPTPSNLLLYEQSQLIGFLSLFFFYENGCELILLVDPDWRRLGLARKLIQAIIPLLRIEKIKRIILPAPTKCGQPWLPAQGFTYEHSEYELTLPANHILTPIKPRLIVRDTMLTDTAVIASIDAACFPTGSPPPIAHFQQLIKNPSYTILLAFLKQQAIGKVHIFWGENCCRLSDIGILPQQQNEGYGSEMLYSCINYIQNKQKFPIHLDVETSNHSALNLYYRLGFKINNACDYWVTSFYGISRLVSGV